MNSIKRIFAIVISVFLLSGIKSFADTFVVTNLNDPGAGSFRQAITNSNLNPGPDEIVFEEGLEGTIVLNVGSLEIQDDLTITGLGAERITIDADSQSPIFEINDFDDEVNSIVKISGLRLINGDGGINNYAENLTVEACEFINGNATFAGGAILNMRILTVDSCLFENNIATDAGGAIYNGDQALIFIIRNSEFVENQVSIGGGGAIFNEGTVELITNSTFRDNNVSGVDSSGGAILNANASGTINEISHCTFDVNTATIAGGAIFNQESLIRNIVNSTFTDNVALTGSVIRNDGLINISFTTIADNNSLPPPPDSPFAMVRAGVVTVGGGVTRVRNSILASNSPDNCFGFLDDFGGNYSNDFSCGLFGDGSVIILGTLTDNGGPTETMALLGGDPVDGATVNCDALNDIGSPSGIPTEADQRYFPRLFGIRCDSGAFEAGPESNVTITKASEPPGGEGFEFESDGFDSLVGCGFRGDNGNFTLDDEDSIGCRVPVGNYTISENVPAGYEVFIVCFGDNENLIIDNDKGEIIFSVPEIEPSPDVDCLFTNVRIRTSGGGGCALAPAGSGTTIPLYLLIPILIFIRRFVNRYRRSLIS